MVDAKLEEDRLQLEKIEVGIDAKKSGVKMRADKRSEQNKMDLEVIKLADNKKD